MVEIVLEEVVFGEAPQVAVLDFVQIFETGSSQRWHI